MNRFMRRQEMKWTRRAWRRRLLRENDAVFQVRVGPYGDRRRIAGELAADAARNAFTHDAHQSREAARLEQEKQRAEEMGIKVVEAMPEKGVLEKMFDRTKGLIR